ncbi:MAG: hypothetical protein ACE5GW_02385 [Planctomycetota bacterium]
MKRLSTDDFLATHPVFSLEDFAAAIGTGRPGALERVKHHARRGRLKRVAKGIYAAVPRGMESDGFIADRYLVAAAARPEGILSHHAALELLGAALREWSECTVLCAVRRSTITLNGVDVRFLLYPTALRRKGAERLGVRHTQRQGRSIAHSGPERTLVDGFRQPRLVGGLDELVASAASFGVLDLDLLEKVLASYAQSGLWACVGWFLERHQERFLVPDAFLTRLESERPRSAHYVPRSQRSHRGGVFVRRWSLVFPEGLAGDGP